MSARDVPMSTNGTAVEGVCVTRRSHPATCPVSLAGNCPGGNDGYGGIFAVTVRVALGAIALQIGC